MLLTCTFISQTCLKGANSISLYEKAQSATNPAQARFETLSYTPFIIGGLEVHHIRERSCVGTRKHNRAVHVQIRNIGGIHFKPLQRSLREGEKIVEECSELLERKSAQDMFPSPFSFSGFLFFFFFFFFLFFFSSSPPPPSPPFFLFQNV